MTTSVQPFLMFEGEAEAAMRFYVSLFADGEVVGLDRHGPEQPAVEGKVVRGLFRIAGQHVRCFDSPVHHAFTFTPAASLFVECEDEAQIDRLNAALSEGGQALMPIADYGFSRRFAWLNDRFGVSWQLNLA
ncbi:MAG TPA: VOC family protein [Caulobacteraceae bacterium]|jgi:predicted 3-demethylubiquinone-9 3-methyltransferase (glyoxalase superfamily)|nr:VOC family protein [Caulobacteraceae bacterium]